MGARDVKVSVIKKIKFNLVVLFFSVELKLNIANVCVCVFFLIKNDVLVRLGIQSND